MIHRSITTACTIAVITGCLQIAGCARVPRSLMTGNWSKNRQSESADPVAQLKDEAKSSVAANTAASTKGGWFAGRDNAGERDANDPADSESTTARLAAFIPGRKTPETLSDPFIGADHTQPATADANPSPSVNPAGWENPFVQGQSSQHPGIQPANASDGSQNQFVSDFDSQLDRLRNTMHQDARAAKSELESGDIHQQEQQLQFSMLMTRAQLQVQQGQLADAQATARAAETFARENAITIGPDQIHPTGLLQQIHRQLAQSPSVGNTSDKPFSVSPNGHPFESLPSQDRSSVAQNVQLEKDFPWAQRSTASNSSASNEAVVANNSAEERIPEVELLSAPPIAVPSLPQEQMARNPFAPPEGNVRTAEVARAPAATPSNRFRAPWDEQESAATRGIHQAHHHDGVPQHERPAHEQVTAMTPSTNSPPKSPRLAVISPMGQTRQQEIMAHAEVAANAARDLHAIHQQSTHAQPPQPSAAAVPPMSSQAARDAAFASNEEDVFSRPAGTAEQRGTIADWSQMEPEPSAPAPPITEAAEIPPQPLHTIAWDDADTVETKANADGVPLPIVFGLCIAVAVIVGLVARRRTNVSQHVA